jgi:hypothetical protein
MEKKWIAVLTFLGLSGAVMGQQVSSAPPNTAQQTKSDSSGASGTLLKHGEVQKKLLKSQQEAKLLKNQKESKWIKKQSEMKSQKDQASQKIRSAQAESKYQKDHAAQKLNRSQAEVKIKKLTIGAASAAKQ